MQGPQGFVPGGFAVWGLSPKGLTSCVKGIRISHLDKSLVSAIMKTKGDTVTCSQAPDLIANMLYQLTIRLPSSGQHAFVESASSKIAVSSKNCNAFFHIGITSLRINCAGVGGLTTKVTVSLCSSLAYCVELCQC